MTSQEVGYAPEGDLTLFEQHKLDMLALKKIKTRTGNWVDRDGKVNLGGIGRQMQ